MIRLHQTKYLTNLGMIARIAGCYGVEDVEYSGCRISMDVARLPRELRMKQYPKPINVESISMAGTPVAVEFLDSAQPLETFEHPADAVYVFGPEDGTLPPDILRKCHAFVRIPTEFCLSLPVSVATILYDRKSKMR